LHYILIRLHMKKITLVLIFHLILFSSCGSNKKASINKEAQVKAKLEQIYKKYKGTKYRYGGTTSRGFDCSGFVQRVYKEAFNIDLPRSTRDMMKLGKKINKNELKPGDLVFFHPTRKYYHVGIYLGNGVFIHASTSRGVIKSDLSLNYWKKSYIKGRRIL